MSLLLYDVTTLYFEVEKEDGLRNVDYSKERRVDPHIIVRRALGLESPAAFEHRRNATPTPARNSYKAPA